MDSAAGTTAPGAFERAVASVRSARTRPELTVTEIPAPKDLAPYAIALAADIAPSGHAADSDLGTGRFVLLHDPAVPQAWGGAFRVVCFAQAPLETDIGVDPFVADVAWSWLIDALAARGAQYRAPSGTATKILSTGYGELADEGDGAQLEIRASWTPVDANPGRHVESWSDLLCMLAGLPPVAEGVSLLSARRMVRE